MKKYECVSKVRCGCICSYTCAVETEFEPKGCLYMATWEKWQEVRGGK